MANSRARLIARFGAPPAEEYSLLDDTSLGRESFNDIVLNYPELSRRHARISLHEEGYVLEDLNSTNGTFVNGRRVTEPVWLEDGDEVNLAEAVGFRFVEEDAAAKTMPISRETIVETETDRPRAAVYPLPEENVAQRPPAEIEATEYEFDYDDYDYDDYDYEAVEQAEPLVPTPEVEPRRAGCGRWLIGCTVLLLILALGCVGTLFLLDTRYPNLLYCGSMEPLVQLAADVLTLLGFGPYQAHPCPIT